MPRIYDNDAAQMRLQMHGRYVGLYLLSEDDRRDINRTQLMVWDWKSEILILVRNRCNKYTTIQYSYDIL